MNSTLYKTVKNFVDIVKNKYFYFILYKISQFETYFKLYV